MKQYLVPYLVAPCLAAQIAATVPAAQEPPSLELEHGDVICLLGNSLAERMQHHGWLEVALQSLFPDRELTLRNLGFSADELAVHQRTLNFGKFTADGLELTLENERFVPWDRYLEYCQADFVFAFFGYNESFAGAAGIESFRVDLEAFVDHTLAQRYGGEPGTLVLFGSIPQEDHGDVNLPDGRAHNERIRLYDRVAASVAERKGVRFVELFTPMLARYAAAEEPLTINGIHLTERGNRVLAEVIEEALFGPRTWTASELELSVLRNEVLEKNLLWFNRYRATDGYNTYGGRSRKVYTGATGGEPFSNFEVLQREMDHIDALTAHRDRRIHALANGGRLPSEPPGLPELIAVETNTTGEEPDGAHSFLSGKEALGAMTAAPGMRVNLFADEGMFPELANPVQMAWDTAGRLWVAVWPTYPHWRPDLPMNDKLLVLEDIDGDGRADRCTTFAGDLHNPTGFELWNGGVLLAAAPDLLFLKDTDGDGRADVRERLLHGLSSADTHHSANSFVLGPDGALYFQEGTFHQSQIESIHGPVRNRNGCVWRFEPRTFRVERYIPYGFANPHGHVFDRWGQDFVTDGTGNQNYYALPFSGYLPEPLGHRSYFTFFRQRSRPSAATEILSSRHFPAENQGNYLIANVIGFRGIFQYELLDDGAGFGAREVAPIVESADPNFRPVDLEIGPDGALYFLDWHNPLIGHLQHHIRDPSRDASHGRVYRVSYPERELLAAPTILGAPIEALLELLKSPEDRVRYRVRIELSGRDTEDVLSQARSWIAGLDSNEPDFEHHLLEALWLHQQHNRMDRELLVRLLNARDPRARAAATRVLRYGRHLVSGALELLADRAADEHARVRLEAVVAASFFDTPAAVPVALESLRRPADAFLEYALGETVRALEPHWMQALRDGVELVAGNPAGSSYLLERVEAAELRELPHTSAVLQALLTHRGVDGASRLEAAAALAESDGSTPAAQLLRALLELDGSVRPHAAEVIDELGGLLLNLVGPSTGPDRDALAALAQGGQQPTTRALGYALVVERDGSTDRAWASARTSRAGLLAMLSAVPRLSAPHQRSSLYEHIRPLALAPESAEALSGFGDESGLEVSYFEPAPGDARREVFADLIPSATLESAEITLDLAAVARSDSFGLSFSGMLRAPESGEYIFHLRSDDGSRLYIGESCVVDNDGAHSMAEASGSVHLDEGLHPLLVTYFEQGGDEGLDVFWQGPGFERRPIRPRDLGSRGTRAIREAAVRALAHVPEHPDDKLADAARLLEQDVSLVAVIELIRSAPGQRSSVGRIQAIVESIATRVSGLPLEQRLGPYGAEALEAGRALAAHLPEELAASARERLERLGGTTIRLRTLPHQMLYDRRELWVEAGQPVTIVFENNDMMPHNLVIAAPGSLVEVGKAAEALSGGDFIPDLASVLWHTRLLLPGESQRLTFVAPETPGDHPYVCTYPGHWRLMNGVLHVVERLTPDQRLTESTEASPGTSARRFVRDWTMADLEPRFTDDWEQGRSAERGRSLFEEAGCIKCHAGGERESSAGPRLAQLRERHRGADLLRHVLEPSLDVLDEFVFRVFELEGGDSVTGRVVADTGGQLHVATTLLEPDALTVVPKEAVVEQMESALSPMPSGLLVTLTEDEILDLVHYLQAPVVESETDERWLHFEGTPGLAGNGRRIVLMAGDEEYRSEEALPMLAKILAVHHGFETTVLFSQDRESGEIAPDEQTHIPGMHLLDEADMLVCFLRFRELPDEDMRHFVDYVESGKPLLGIRTATHAFSYSRDRESPYSHYDWRSKSWPGGFGRQILGETWVSHHGAHGSQSTRGIVEARWSEHPVLRGVEDVWGPTDVYTIANLPDDAVVLLRGQVLEGMQSSGAPVTGPQNDPMMPLVWLRELERENAVKQRVACSTIGAAIDCESEGLRRLFVNACYWGLGMEAQIPPKSRVDTIGDYSPSFFGFGAARTGVRPASHALK